jgi:hypothetical protein
MAVRSWRLLATAGGLAPWRLLAIAAVLSATAWLAFRLHGWCWAAPYVAFPAYAAAPVLVLGHSARRGMRFRDMARGLPFLMWGALMADGKLAAWKLVLWPVAIPAEAVSCLLLGVCWLLRPFGRARRRDV